MMQNTEGKAMAKVVMTYGLAMAAGTDAANARMRKAGRTKWNRADYNEAVRKFNALYPLDAHLEALRNGTLPTTAIQG